MSLVLFAFSRLFMAACGSFNPQNSWCLNRVSYDRRQRSFNMTKLSTTWLKSDVAACWCSVWRAFAGTRSVTILVNVCRFEASWWLWIFRDLFSCIVCIQIWYIVYTHLLFSEIPKNIPHILTKKSLQKRFFFQGCDTCRMNFHKAPGLGKCGLSYRYGARFWDDSTAWNLGDDGGGSILDTNPSVVLLRIWRLNECYMGFLKIQLGFPFRKVWGSAAPRWSLCLQQSKLNEHSWAGPPMSRSGQVANFCREETSKSPVFFVGDHVFFLHFFEEFSSALFNNTSIWALFVSDISRVKFISIW